MAEKPSGSLSLIGGWKGIFAIVVSGLVGITLGLAVFTFVYAGGLAYFGSDPQTCNQCHAMNEQYNAWQKGSHADVAGCNDCHAPHDNLVLKYANKAENGFMHSLKFTLQNYPENIQIREHNRRVTEAACVYCHGNFVEQIKNDSNHRGETLSCIRCHDGVGPLR